ncbi:hypothetical protein E2C01_029759 [Portunus trituberculatus]|uniref:Uncharacterized protein n=1 Tax=Portunus trituberculatus TaxID=210409 RepID=A0A5B7ESC2_PORTR|nr:hypothetical protein [Portunus trituberculatus]
MKALTPKATPKLYAWPHLEAISLPSNCFSSSDKQRCVSVAGCRCCCADGSLLSRRNLMPKRSEATETSIEICKHDEDEKSKEERMFSSLGKLRKTFMNKAYDKTVQERNTVMILPSGSCGSDGDSGGGCYGDTGSGSGDYNGDGDAGER